MSVQKYRCFMLYRIENERLMKRYDKKNETNTSRYRKYKSKGIKKETSVITRITSMFTGFY